MTPIKIVTKIIFFANISSKIIKIVPKIILFANISTKIAYEKIPTVVKKVLVNQTACILNQRLPGRKNPVKVGKIWQNSSNIYDLTRENVVLFRNLMLKNYDSNLNLSLENVLDVLMELDHDDFAALLDEPQSRVMTWSKLFRKYRF